MSATALLFTLAFVLVVMGISLWQRLDLERDLLVGTLRAGLQLLLVGYVLLQVFAWESWAGTLAMVAVMVAVATHNAARRGRDLPGVGWRVLVAIAAAAVVTLGFMLALGIIPPSARYVVPISGMMTGNAMVVAGLLLNRLQAELAARRDQVQVWLALGATPRQAVAGVLKASVRAAMIPSIDAMKTVGLVQLPGMMTGQILAGASPLEAVKYQILIVFAIAAAAGISAMLLGLLCYPLYFNMRAAQLVR